MILTDHRSGWSVCIAGFCSAAPNHLCEMQSSFRKEFGPVIPRRVRCTFPHSLMDRSKTKVDYNSLRIICRYVVFHSQPGQPHPAWEAEPCAIQPHTSCFRAKNSNSQTWIIMDSMHHEKYLICVRRLLSDNPRTSLARRRDLLLPPEESERLIGRCRRATQSMSRPDSGIHPFRATTTVRRC